MKHWTKIGAVLTVVGLLVMAGAFTAAGFDVRNLSTMPPYEKKTAVYEAAEVNLFTLKDIAGGVQVAPSPDNRIHVVYYENAYETYQVSQEAGVVRYEKESHQPWYAHVAVFNWHHETFELLIPEGFTGDLDLHTSSGSMAADGISCGQLSLNASSGALSVEAVRCGDAWFSTNSGSVSLGPLTAKTVSVRVSSGAITLEEVEAGAVTLQTNAGEIDLSGIAAQEVSARTSTGQIALEAIVAQTLSAQCSSGGILLSEVDAQDLTLKTSAGTIRGTVAGQMGDYSITSSAGNVGNNNLPASLKAGDRKLDARTNMGEIRIEFLED